MEMWEGWMNWPLVAGWKCQTCGQNSGLTWGLQHAVCRCNTCHTQYYMRDDAGKMTDTPICMLKDDYREPARVGYVLYARPISTWSDIEWDTAISTTNYQPPAPAQEPQR